MGEMLEIEGFQAFCQVPGPFRNRVFETDWQVVEMRSRRPKTKILVRKRGEKRQELRNGHLGLVIRNVNFGDGLFLTEPLM